MKKSEVVTILGSQSCKCEDSYTSIPEDATILTYKTEYPNQKVLLTSRGWYFKYITDSKGKDLLHNQTEKVYTTFKDVGEHKIAVKINNELNSFEYCFYECENLQSIPEDLFRNCYNVRIFSYCFFGCASLNFIPNRLLYNCTKATSFESCFERCRKLSFIPEDLFTYCPDAKFFTDCFKDCSGILDIPEEWK